MVGFEHDYPTTAEMFVHHGSRFAKISCDADSFAVACNRKAGRINGVMADGEGMNFQRLYLKRRTTLEVVVFVQFTKPNCGFAGRVRQENGQLEAPGQYADSLNVIGVLMGDNQAIQCLRVQADGLHPSLNLRC